jgi:hypothetical protein
VQNNKYRDLSVLNEEYEENIFKLLMKEVADKEGQLFYEENINLLNDPEYTASPEKVKKFTKLLDAQYKKANSNRNPLRLSKIARRAAVVAVLFVTIFALAMISVQAFRNQILNLFMNVNSNYTSLQLTDDSTSDSSDGKLAVNWRNSYVPTYIPADFEIASVSNSDDSKKIMFQSKTDENSFINYSEYSADSSIEIDTENADSINKVSISEQAGTIAVKDKIVTVAWQLDGRLFVVQGQISTDEAIKIADNVKFIK